MQQGDAVGREQFFDPAEEQRVLRPADMLEHADADDRVEPAGNVGEALAVVLQKKLDTILQPAFTRALLRDLELLHRQRDADAVRAVVLGQVHRQAAPATADVEHTRAGAQVELGGDVRALGLLCRLERVARIAEVATGVVQVAVEEAPVDGVVDIVVMVDVGLRAPARVELVQVRTCPVPPAQRRGVGPQVIEIADADAQDVGERRVQRVPATVHVGLGEGQARVAQHVPHHGWFSQRQRDGRVAGAEAPAAPVRRDEFQGACTAVAPDQVKDGLHGLVTPSEGRVVRIDDVSLATRRHVRAIMASSSTASTWHAIAESAEMRAPGVRFAFACGSRRSGALQRAPP